MYKKANSNDSNTRSKAADDVLDNIDKREKTFDKEVSILKNSEKQFKKGDSHINDIKNDNKRKKVKQLDDAIKNKYKTHDDYAKAYRNVLSKEKDLFEKVEQSFNEKNLLQTEKNFKIVKSFFSKESK